MAGKWTPAEILLAALGVAGVGVGTVVIVRRLMDAGVLPLPIWMPLPLLPSWIPGAPPAEEGVEPAAENDFGGSGMSKRVIGYKRGKAIQLDLISVGGSHWLASGAAEAFLEMKEAAVRENITLRISTSFRDMAFQEKLYAKYQAGTGSLAAKPGFSNHQAGTALDLETANGTNNAYVWLTKNAAKFGYRRTVSSEPWHWEWFAPNIA